MYMYIPYFHSSNSAWFLWITMKTRTIMVPNDSDKSPLKPSDPWWLSELSVSNHHENHENCTRRDLRTQQGQTLVCATKSARPAPTITTCISVSCRGLRGRLGKIWLVKMLKKQKTYVNVSSFLDVHLQTLINKVFFLTDSQTFWLTGNFSWEKMALPSGTPIHG